MTMEIEQTNFLPRSTAKFALLLSVFFGIMSTGLSYSNNLMGQEILERRLTVELEGLTFEEAIDKLQEMTDVSFLYLSGIVDKNEKIDFNVKNKQLSYILDKLCKSLEITYEVDGNYIVLSKDEGSKATQLIDLKGGIENGAPKKIRGTVLDDSGEPVPGATILIQGTTTGTITNFDGTFILDIDDQTPITLEISFIGFVTVEVPVKDQNDVTVRLELDMQQLEEVVVVGYGTQKKADVIGSVSTVKGDELNIKSVASFDAGLQGMAAGVSVLSQSGKPGAPSTIKIRGANSIQSSTDPLWVIDGMPVYSSPAGLGSSNQNPMSLFNPNDIESIQVLKDAAATSIYGSRGSNGVIIVTTKSGTKGKSFTNVNFSSGISDLSRTIDDVGYVNSSEWFDVMDQAYQNSFDRNFTMNDYYQFVPLAFDRIDREEAEQINTDWYDEIFRKGSFQDLNISSSKGFEGGSYYLSGNYRSDKGVLENNQLDKVSLRSNLAFEPITDLTIETKLNFSYTNNERRDDDLTTITKFSLPWMPVRLPENDNLYFNPYANANIVSRNDPDNTLNNVKQYRTLANVSLNYLVPFVDGLSLRTEMAADIIQSNLVNWQSRNIRLDGGKNPSAFAREEAVTYRSVNYNFYPTYVKSFGESSINAVLGIEAQRINQYERIMSGEGLTGDYQEIGVPRTLLSIEGRQNNERYLLGYFGRINYKLRDKYLVGVSWRRDGSSVFTEEYRWGNFVALSGGWILSQEPFMAWMGRGSYLKIRGSYGETGNQNVPNNLQEVNFFDQAIYGSRQFAANGTVPSNLPVRDLTWETTRSSDVGLDFGFLNDRINGTIGYYRRFIDGMLLQAQLPSSAGVSPSSDMIGRFEFLSDVDGRQTNKIWSNIGNMVNSGVEFELYTVNIDRSDFRWSTSFNIAFNRNIIEGLTPDLDASGQGITSEYTISSTDRKRNVWYVANYAGVDPASGVPYIEALDQDYYEETGNTRALQSLSGGDSLLLGTRKNVTENKFIQGDKSSDPTYYGGFTNKLEYKGFDFSFFFSFSGGNYILDYDRQVAVYPNETRMLLREVIDNSWEQEGDIAKYPKLVARRTFQVDGSNVADFGDEDVFHNRDLYKADYIRLRSVTLGYNLPANYLKRLKIQGLRVYLSGNNLWTSTNYPGFDPEGIPNPNGNTNGAHILYWNTPIPQLKSFIFGLDLKI